MLIDLLFALLLVVAIVFSISLLYSLVRWANEVSKKWVRGILSASIRRRLLKEGDKYQ